MQSCKLEQPRKWIVTERCRYLLLIHSPIPHQQCKSGLKSFNHVSLGTRFIFLRLCSWSPPPVCSVQTAALHTSRRADGLRTPFTTIQVGLGDQTLLPGSYFSLPRLLHSSPEEIKLKSCLSEMLYSRVMLNQFGHDGT